MRILVALLVSLLVVSTTACTSKKWPKETKQEMLESCIRRNTHQYWPRDPEKELRDATQACKCVVRKMEVGDPKPPETVSAFHEKSKDFVVTCERHGSSPSLVCSQERQQMDKVEWGDTAMKHLVETCFNKKPDGVPFEQFANYCRCLFVRVEAATPQQFTSADFVDGTPPDVLERRVKEFFTLAKPYEDSCRSTHIGENSLPLNEIGLRKTIYGKSGWRQSDEDEMFNSYVDRYDCASLKARDSFFRCVFTGGLKWRAEQKRLGNDNKKQPLSEFEEQVKACSKENSPSLW